MKQVTFSLLLAVLFFANGMAQHSDPVVLKNGSYLFEQFEEGTVLLKSGEVEKASLNYNTSDQSIAFMKDNTIMVLVDLPNVDTVYFQGKKFVPFENKIYEVVDVIGDQKFFISYSNKVVPLTATADHEGTSKQSDSRVSNTVSNVYLKGNYKAINRYELINHYWLFSGKELVSFNNEGYLTRKYRAKASLIRKFVRENHINFNKEEDLKKLMLFCKE